MTEYVEKELLYKRLLEKSNDEKSCGYLGNLFIYALRDVFSELPTADVVEVVRCKDCAYYREENGYCMNPHCSSSFYGHRVREERYCSYGERSEGE